MVSLRAVALGLCLPLLARAGDQPPPPPITINWDRVGAATVGFVAGLVGLLVGAGAGSTLGCAVESTINGDCGDLRVIPSVLLGLATGAAAGFVAVELYWGELGATWDPSEPNVSGRLPSPNGLILRLEY